MSNASIGVFDSGVGGLTVARAILDQLPHEPLLYVGDTAHGPYGPPPDRRGAPSTPSKVMDHLVDDGVKMLVIACNSASSACLRDARERYDVPVVEVVLPGCAPRRPLHAHRPGRRHRHPGDDRQQGLRRRLPCRARDRTDHGRVPALRRLRRAGRDLLARAAGARRASTSTRCSAPRWTPSCSAARTTRCSPGC